MTVRRAAVLLGACSLMAVALSSLACGSERYEHPPPREALQRQRTTQPDESVAQVADHPVGLDSFQRLWRRHPDLEATEVIDRRIDREVGVRRALDEEVVSERKIALARKRAMVMELLSRTVESEVTRDDLDESAIERVEKDVRKYRGRPAGLRVTHLLVALPEKLRESDGEPSARVARLRDRAEKWAGRIRDELSEEASVTEMFRVRDRFDERISEPLRVVGNAHLSFPRPSARKFEGELPESWSPVVEGLARSAERMAEEGRVGKLSDPVASSYGWHVVRLEDQLEARVPEPEALREFAAETVLRRRRSRQLSKTIKSWRDGMRIWMEPGALADDRVGSN